MKLSICCITYNHGSYIDMAIQSFVAQKTTFDFEIVISDDASTDGTFELVSEYCKTYSNIKYHRHAKNIGMMANGKYTLEKCTGEYIALCEGDDYWIDPYKLQKQVETLDANPEYAICFTGYIGKNEFDHTEKIIIPQEITTIEELLKNNRFTTSTAVFASRYFKPVPDWFSQLPGGDWSLYLTVLYRSKKKAYCLEDVTSVYRMHAGGMHGSMYTSNKKIIKTIEWQIECYRILQTNLFKGEYNQLIEDCIKWKENMIADLLDEHKNRPNVLNEITNLIPAGATFILVDDWNLNVSGEVDGRTVLPFTEQDGLYWGPPLDDAAAIAEIERQCKRGIYMIIFTWMAFWWLDYYGGMYDYLKSNYRCLVNNKRLIGFCLQKKRVSAQVRLTVDAI